MNAQAQNPFSQHRARLDSQPPGLLGKMIAFVARAGLLVLGFMFSMAALIVVAVGSVLFGSWIWWKTRSLRQQMREQDTAGGQIIEGEVIRQNAGGSTGSDTSR